MQFKVSIQRCLYQAQTSILTCEASFCATFQKRTTKQKRDRPWP